jgi:fluoroquinolone transport system permease protein
MNAWKALRALGPIDAHSVRRDALLRWMIVVPPLMALAARSLLPQLVSRAGELAGHDLLPYYEPLMGYTLLLFTPALVGMIIGFLLLDQRDDQTLSALRVTPLSLGNYLAYRLTVPMALSFALSIIAFPIAGFRGVDAAGIALAAFVAAPFAPLMALALGTFAANKVQGFALTKAQGVVFMLPLIAFFVDSPWTWLVGLVPSFWAGKVYWLLLARESLAWPVAAIGLIYQALLLWLLLRRFNAVSSR